MRAGLDAETDRRTTGRGGKVESWSGPRYRRRYGGAQSCHDTRGGNPCQETGCRRQCGADAEDEDDDDGLVVGVFKGAIPLARCLEHLHTDAERQHRRDQQSAEGPWHVAHHIIRDSTHFECA